MTTECLLDCPVIHRNFNICPHCLGHGQHLLLSRLAEGFPMISRSDGETFHLLLADRPQPYPVDYSCSPADKISVCFWYCHDSRPGITSSTIVILPESRANHPAIFRRIEAVADLLSQKLALCGLLAELYEISADDAKALAS